MNAVKAPGAIRRLCIGKLELPRRSFCRVAHNRPIAQGQINITRCERRKNRAGNIGEAELKSAVSEPR